LICSNPHIKNQRRERMDEKEKPSEKPVKQGGTIYEGK